MDILYHILIVFLLYFIYRMFAYIYRILFPRRAPWPFGDGDDEYLWLDTEAKND